MTQLIRGIEPMHLSNKDLRLSKSHVSTAKKQAYILRDLIKQFCNYTIKGADVTDFFANLYYGTDWVTLTNKLSEASSTPYFASSILSSAHSLNIKHAWQLIPALKSRPIFGALTNMPSPSYTTPRTLEGAKIASVLNGQEIMTLLRGLKLFDANTDQPVYTEGFTSCPETNEEKLIVKSITGKGTTQYTIPLSDVRFTRYHKPSSKDTCPYYLEGHAPNSPIAKAMYRDAANVEISANWFAGGNKVRLFTIKHGRVSGTHIVSLEDFKNFPEAMNYYRGKDSCNVVLTPITSSIQKPSELHNPNYASASLLLPEIEKADEAFHNVLNQVSSIEDGFQAYIRAVDEYNKVLKVAHDALCYDMRNVNSKAEMAAWEPKEQGDLYFSNTNPLSAFKQLINAKGGK